MGLLLLSYGTLQLERVQLETFGRKLIGKKDVLHKYCIESLEITDSLVLTRSEQKNHPIAVKTGNKNDLIEGVIFELTEQELRETDQYEVAGY